VKPDELKQKIKDFRATAFASKEELERIKQRRKEIEGEAKKQRQSRT
jgi:hypothetical protein